MKPNEVPNSYQDLLDPRWAGRLGLEASEVDWFGSMVKAMGEAKGLEFFRKLAQQRPQMRTGHTLMGELQSIQFLAALSDRLFRSGYDQVKAKETDEDEEEGERSFGVE